MPSLAINSTINCCSSRDPPSPESLSPRPVISPVKIPKKASIKLSKDHLPSISSVDAAELRAAILFDEKSNSPTVDPEARVNSNTKLKTILDVDAFQNGDSTKPFKARKSVSSLNLKEITQKLKKHLSRESTLNKRHSRLSVGTSEEEIERRAELRRLRQKRIREELSNEGIYDDDANSLPSVRDTASDIYGQTSWNPGDPLFLPALNAPVIPLPALPLPKLEPIERQHASPLEHSESMTLGPTPSSVANLTGSSHTMVNSNGTISRRHSSPILSDFEVSFADPRVYIPSRKRSSIPPIPLNPSIQPQRIPSLAEPQKSSWRLSFTSPNRGQHLRKLSQEYTVPLSLTSEILGGSRPPVHRWLHSQGLPSPYNGIGSTEDTINLESFTSHSQTCSITLDLGGVDGPEDGSPAIHLYEMEIPQRLASRRLQNSTSSPQVSSWGSHQRGILSMSSDSNITRTGRGRYLRDTSDSIPLSERIPQSWGKIIQDETSSAYPSAGNSFQPSRQSSCLNLMSLFVHSKEKINLIEKLELDPTLPVPTKVDVQTGDDSLTCLTIPSTPYARRSTVDDCSVLASETESFREREAELRVVQARFASDDVRGVPNTPKSSRFREEFDFEPSSAKLADVKTRKKSAFARLTKYTSRSYDGANGMEDLLAVPMPNFQPNATPARSPGGLNPLSASSDVTAIWEKAVKLTADEKANSVGSHLHIPRKRRSHGQRKKGSMSGTLRSLSWKKGDKGKGGVGEQGSAAAEYEKRFQERLAVKELVMDDWEAEMAATAQKAKAKSKNIVKKTRPPTGPDRRFPLNWSRYPSHSRSERSLSAGRADRVEHHDFAMRVSENGERIFHKCREIGDLHLHDDDPEWHKHDPEEMGLRARVGDRISQKVYQLETHGGGSKAFEFQTDGRRGSMMVASKLEFPELEILPVTPIISKEELEQNVNEQKMIDTREEKKRMASKMGNYGDGSVDSGSKDGKGDNSVAEDLEMSIADPRFYDDCIVLPVTDDDMDAVIEALEEVRAVQPKSLKKEKFRTWHGRDWDGYKYTGGRRDVSFRTISLRKSTVDYHSELEKMEEVERERVLKTAEDAWGSRK